MGVSRHKLSAGRHLGAGRLVRLYQDVYGYNRPVTTGGGGGPECPEDDPCCVESSSLTSYFGDLLDNEGPNGTDYLVADQSINKGLASGATSGFSMNRVFGFGVINITVPSYTQLFSENRKNLNNVAKLNHTPSFIIGHDLSYAKYDPKYPIHRKFPSANYQKVKSVIESTALLSMGDNSDFIDNLPTHLNQSKIDFTYDASSSVTPRPVTDRGSNDPRNEINRTGGSGPPDITQCPGESACEFAFGANYCQNGGHCDRYGTAILPNGGDCCRCCGVTIQPPVELDCQSDDDCGECETCFNGECQKFPDCCGSDSCDDIDCGVCKTCEVNSSPASGQCYTCVNDSSSTHCSCPGNECEQCQVCSADGSCQPVTCNPAVNGGFFDTGDEDCCPTGETGPTADNCNINPCPVDQNLCCDPVTGNCVQCDDPCPNVFSYSFNGSGSTGALTSLKGNYTPRDLYVPGYFVHDMNQGNVGSATIIQSNDIIMSCVLELTIKNVYGRLAYTGAKPYVRPTQFNVYRVKQAVEPLYATPDYYSEEGDAWSAPYGRHPDDIDINNVVTFTVGTDVKAGDKLHIDITKLAKIAQSQDNSVIRLMIEPTSYFQPVTTGTTAKLGKQENARSAAMLLEFHDSSALGPKVRINVHQGLRSVTSRRFPWLKTPS